MELALISKFVNKTQTTMVRFATMTKMKEVLLSDLKIGQKAKIVRFTTEEIFLKLMEMGCLPGENVTIIKKAPLKDPISVGVAGYILSLRLDEARHIVVDVIN